MFQFLFRYPLPVFNKGRFVLLSAWPAWLLLLLMLAACVGLALLIRRRMRSSDASLPKGRGIAIWALQSALISLLLFLLWQPAISVSELNSQQNIIAVLVDDSRSMNIADSGGRPRESAAIAALEGGVLAGLEKRFQTRIYRLGGELKRVDAPKQIAPVEAATHISRGLEQLVSETSDLPQLF